MIIKRHLGPALLILLLTEPVWFNGCAGLKNTQISSQFDTEADDPTPDETEAIPLLREYPLPAGLKFLPDPFSLPSAVPGIGAITREKEDPMATLTDDEKRALTESFRTAYVDGLLRKLPLEGTLGGDFAHSWPPAAPLCRVQNWRTRDAAPNSWGIPSLVLAIQEIRGNEVYIVQGAVLNQYGLSGGINRANGAVGYGAPLGEEFPYEGGVAQRFEYGLIRVDAARKGLFIPNETPAEEGEAAIPHTVGLYSKDDVIIQKSFQSAWRRNIHAGLPDLDPDYDVRRLDFFGKPWEIATESGAIPINTLYFQTFNQGSVLFLLAQSSEVSFQTRIIAGDFLNAFLAGKDLSLPGAEAATPLPEIASAGELPERLLQGLSRYGIPLTNAYLSREEEGYMETQRFSLGRMGKK
ncbi:hypothetical protein LQZ19_05800 [Treponema primitia]|uniref:hypothetical protein n=1 Tax=Treponema primitia TaxID=88058 RepID=UPI0039817E26